LIFSAALCGLFSVLLLRVIHQPQAGRNHKPATRDRAKGRPRMSKQGPTKVPGESKNKSKQASLFSGETITAINEAGLKRLLGPKPVFPFDLDLSSDRFNLSDCQFLVNCPNVLRKSVPNLLNIRPKKKKKKNASLTSTSCCGPSDPLER